MKRIVSLIITFAMICTLCPAFPLSSVITASAANQTYYYGFEDGKLPAEMSTVYCKNPTYANGIFSFTPQNDDPMITLNKTFSADEVNQIKIRMYHNLTTRIDNKDLYQIQVYYKGTDASGKFLSGEVDKLSEGNSVKKKINLSSDGKFITYTLDFTNANWAGSTITQLRIDPVSSNSVEGDTVKIDYIMLCKKADELDPIISYEFEKAGNFEGFEPVSALKSFTNVVDGCLNYSNLDNSSYDISYSLPGISVSTNIYEYIEVMMAHDITVSGKTSDLLKIYIEATLADGTVNKIERDSDTIKCTLKATSNGEHKRYLFPLTALSDGTSLIGATITKIRIDPINYNGSFSIDSIRILPHYVQYEPLDKTKMALSYTFANNDTGCAKGTIKLDFGGQNPLFAKNVELIWANGNATDGYTPLENYTSLTSKKGSQIANGYVISRPLYIPEGATALIARVTDTAQSFDMVTDLPSSKVTVKSEPKFVAALASDFHFGDASVALNQPAQKYYDLQNHVQANADTLLVAGDIVQWYGVRDRNEYYHLEYLSGKTEYASYAEYDPTALPSQWDMAMEYFQSWDIPVFIIEGNHETPSSGRIAQGHTGKYMKDWMTEWVNYTNNKSMYDNFTTREKHIYDNTYEYSTNYDNYVTAKDGTQYHVINLRNLHMGTAKLTEQELEWLDKKLYENEADGTPTFVIMHVPFKGTVIPEGLKHSNDFTDAGFKAVVDKHPNAVIVSGHTHYSLYSDMVLAINGEGTAPSYIHDGAVVDTGIHYPEEGIDSAYSKNNCELVYAEVYEDRIISRAYDVISGKYIATNLNQITLNDETTIGDISVTRTVADGNVILTADCDTDVTYQWYVGGEEAEAGATLTLPETCTDFVAVRATDASGSFRSESFDSIYDADITYDEGRTYFLSMSDADGYNAKMKNNFTSTTKAEWKNVAGKTDNVMHMTYNKAGSRTYLETQWIQKNPLSKYVVLKYNAMPLNDDTTVYLATNQSNYLSTRTKLKTNEWSNVTVVFDMTTKAMTTYINGVFDATIDGNNTKLDKFWNNTDPTKNGIVRLCIATPNGATAASLEAYIDDFEVYETVNAPVVAPVKDMVRAEVNGANAYSYENKLAYIPAGTKAGNLSKAFWCVVVDANGATKAADAVVGDTDKLMYHDPISESYIYYDIKIYSDYNSLFISGAADNAFTANDVKLYVNAKTAGDTVIVAQYDGSDNMVSVQYVVCEKAGLNEVAFTKDSAATYASVFVWNGMDTVKPLAEKVDIK